MIYFNDLIEEIVLIGLNTLSDLKALNYIELLIKYYKEPAIITNASIIFHPFLKYAPLLNIKPLPVIFIAASI